jgi:hypothetical protein
MPVFSGCVDKELLFKELKPVVGLWQSERFGELPAAILDFQTGLELRRN